MSTEMSSKTPWADVYALIMLGALILMACFIANGRGMEADSLRAELANLQAQIHELRPVPRIQIARGTVYAGSSELIVEEVGK